LIELIDYDDDDDDILFLSDGGYGSNNMFSFEVDATRKKRFLLRLFSSTGHK
jgi:hypothetical protein